MINLELNKMVRNILNKQDEVILMCDGKESQGMSCLSMQISKFIDNSQKKKKDLLGRVVDNQPIGNPEFCCLVGQPSSDKLKSGGTHREN